MKRGPLIGVAALGMILTTTASSADYLASFDYSGIMTVRIDEKALEEFRHEAKVMGKAPGWRQIDVAVKQLNIAGNTVDDPELQNQAAVIANPDFGSLGISPAVDFRHVTLELGSTLVLATDSLTAIRQLTIASLTI